MSINVTNGYEQFYKRTEPIRNYGSGEKGNKVMDKMSREET